jgi:glucose-1-phosphate thymidylyltransferase
MGSVKALVLAGGSGTRLRPLTHTSAKQLIPVANKPVLFYGLEQLRDAGITDVGIIVGQTADEVMAAVGDGSALGITVTYIPQEAPLGLAHCVLIAQDFLGDEDFCMFLGDNFLLGGINRFVEEFDSSAMDAQILLTKVPEPQFFGVAVLDEDGNITELLEKPENPPSDLAVVGVYLFGKGIHEAVRSIEPSARGELEITEAIEWLIRSGRTVRSYMVDGYWKDTGRLEDMLECNRRVLEMIDGRVDGQVDAASNITGRVVIEEGAVIERSTVRGPAVIGRDTRIIDSYVGPFTSIYYGCTVENTEVEHSIILENCTLRGVERLQDSLIGKNVEVTRSVELPRAHRLMVGDHSQVRLS